MILQREGVVIPKTCSARKLESNRRNALRSTGPRTAAGKAVSRMNAVRHGVLSEAVVVRGSRVQETAEEFEELRKHFREGLRPVGRLEEALVERIVMAHWRLRRVLAMETEEIVRSVDS